jgi:predicted component of type VI protein secretion system
VAKLIVSRGDNVERELELGSADVRIGRGAENDLVLDEPTKGVSRFHAEIRAEGSGWALIDLNSQNGSWIDGARVQKTTLAPGVTVSLGPYRLKYEDGAAASAPAGVAPAMAALPAAVASTTVSVPVPVAAVTVSPPAAAASAAVAPPVAVEPTPVSPPVTVVAATVAPAPKTADTIVGGKIKAPVPSVAVEPARLVRPPPTPTAKIKRGGSPDNNIVSSLLRNKPLLFGGFGAFIVLVLLGGLLMNASGSSEAVQATPAARAEAPTPAPPTNAEIIAKHLEDGKALLEKGDAATALRDHFEQALIIDPSQPEATELKLKAEEIIRRPAPATALVAAAAGTPSAPPTSPSAVTAPSTTASPSTPASRSTREAASTPAAPSPAASTAVPGAQRTAQGDTSGVTRRPGESQTQWQARSNRVRDHYKQAKAVLKRNDFKTAITALEALDQEQPNYLDVPVLLVTARAGLQSGQTRTQYSEGKAALERKEFAVAIRVLEALNKEQPNYLDVPALLVTAKAGLRSGAQALVTSAAAAEKSGDYAEAVAQLNKAKQLEALPGIDESVQRLTDQIAKEADAAYSTGRVYDARGRVAEAIASYERVVQLLAADHPNRQAAEGRLTALGAKSK